MPPALAVDARARQLDHWLIALAIVGTSLGFWVGALDRIALPKLTVALLLAAGVVIAGAWRMLSTATIRRPGTSPVHVALGVFLAVGFISVVTSESVSRSLLGQRGRASGYLMYVAAAVLFAAAARTVELGSLKRFSTAFATSGAAIGVYGLVQAAGLDPISWNAAFGDGVVFATLANPNFAAGYLALTLPTIIVNALSNRGRRASMAWIAVAVVVIAIVLTRSAQGWIAGAGAAGLVVTVWLVPRVAHRRRRALAAGFAAAGLLGSALIVVGLAGHGPLEQLNDVGYGFRRHYWEAAIDMAEENPVRGVGFDMWGGYYREFRSPDAARGPLTNVTDEPHSVPLAMFASGGVPLGVAYMAFVVLTGLGIIRALFRLGDRDRLVFAGVAGAWLAFQIQSLVSVDQPPFAVAHLCLAGAVAAMSWPRPSTTISVPWLLGSPGGVARPGRPARQSRPRLAGRPAAVLAVVAALFASWQLTRPLRADVRAENGLAARAGRADALALLHGATELVRWEPEYWSLVGDELARLGEPRFALDAYQRALEFDPRRFADVLNAARAAKAAGEASVAEEMYATTLRLEPHNLELQAEVGEFLLDVGRGDDAVQLLKSVATGMGGWKPHALLARALDATAADADAREAWSSATDLVPRDSAVPLAELGGSLRRAGRFDDARPLLERAIALNPDYFVAYYELARTAEAQGRLDEAIALYEQVARSGRASEFPDAATRADALRAELGAG